MGSYNELILKEGGQEIHVQFKHGLKWQYEYRLGDKIDWGRVDRPINADGRIVVSGIAGFPNNNGDRYFSVTFDNDVISNAKEISEREYEELRAKEKSRPVVTADAFGGS